MFEVNKKFSYSVLSLLALAFFLVPQGYAVASLNVTLLGQSPSPVNPGSTVEIVFSVKNNGANSSKFQLLESFPFVIQDSAVKSVSGLSTDQDFSVKYKLKVDERAPAVVNELTVRWAVNSQDLSVGFFEKKFNISVENTRSDFDVAVQEVLPSSVSLAVTNTGKNVASGVVLRARVTGAEIVGADSNTIGSINPGDFTIVTFPLTSVAGDRQAVFTVTVSYSDVLGERYDVVKTVSARIPELAQVLKDQEARVFGIPLFWLAVLGLLLVAALVFKRRRHRGFEDESKRHVSPRD